MSAENNLADWFQSEIDQHRDNYHFILETVLFEFTEWVVSEIQRQNLSRKEFAEKVGLKPSSLSRLLNRKNNMTVATAIKLTWALGYKFDFTLEKLEAANQANPQPRRDTEMMENRIPARKVG